MRSNNVKEMKCCQEYGNNAMNQVININKI